MRGHNTRRQVLSSIARMLVVMVGLASPPLRPLRYRASQMRLEASLRMMTLIPYLISKTRSTWIRVPLPTMPCMPFSFGLRPQANNTLMNF